MRNCMKEELIYCPILKTNINVTSIEEALAYIDAHLDQLRGDYICVSNVHTTVMAFHDENYRKVQNQAAMALPDGKPLAIVSRMRGFRNAKRVPGPDLMPEVFKLSEIKGYTHFFYGSRKETLDKLKENLLERYPKLKISGMYAPPFKELSEKKDQEIIQSINATHADFIWVGLGAPKQEFWMAKHKGKVCGLMLGVGAGFDFHAGTVKRAPRWMQEWCLEWLYRIMQDPKRLLRRYASTNFAFVFHALKEHGKEKKKIRNQYLRIAQIGHKRIPSREGGVEIVVEELSVRYVKKGCVVDAYNRSGYHVSGKEYDTKRSRHYKGIRILTIPTFRSGKLNAIVYSFLATLRAMFGGYDIYHYHAEGPCAMLWIPRILRKNIVVTIHGLDWQRAKWGNFASRVLKFGEKMAVEYADQIIVLSRNIQEYFMETYGRETLFIPNGINKPNLMEAKEITEKWDLKKDEYVLFLARIVPEKGIHYLLEAFSRIDTDKKLVIAGGSSHSNEYMNMISEMADRDSRVVMTHFVQGRKLEELYSNAYLFVLPSDVEGMSVSLLEAMSYGNCCVVSDIPENTEVVGEYAVSFKHGDVDDLQKVLESLLTRPEEVERYKAESQKYICEKYNWDKVVGETLSIYDEMVAIKKNGRKRNESKNSMER